MILSAIGGFMFLNLISLNFFVWGGGLLLFKGVARSYLGILAFLFSGSYWIPVLFFNQELLDGNVVSDYIRENLIYSLVSGISFYVGILIFGRTSLFRKLDHLFAFKKFSISASGSLLLSIKLFACINSSLIFAMALGDIGSGDRIYFLDQLKPFWYIYLIPLNSLAITVWIFLEKKAIIVNSVRRDWLLWLVVFANVALVGFDGSRRQALLPLSIVLLKVIMHNININNSFLNFNKKTIILIFLMLFSSLMTLNRAFDVGWGIFNLELSGYIKYVPTFFQQLLASSPTIHVNTQMLDLVSLEGPHGYSSYFRAVGNCLFPRFIFGQYFFGDPLVLELHQRFGWYGQDFGFMAESIYSGGILGVMIMHFLYGSFVATIMNRCAYGQNSFFFKILALCIVFGAVNSLRSDFMNLLKATFYPAVGIYISYLAFITFRKSLKGG